MKKQRLIAIAFLFIAIGLIAFGIHSKRQEGLTLKDDYEVKTAIEDIFNISFGDKAVEVFRKDYEDDNVNYCIGGIYDDHMVYIGIFKKVGKDTYRTVFFYTTTHSSVSYDKDHHLYIVAGLYEKGPADLHMILKYKDGTQTTKTIKVNKFVLEFISDPQVESIEFEENVLIGNVYAF